MPIDAGSHIYFGRRREGTMMRVGKRTKTWLRREKQRQKGQFWTPDWVADAMVSYVLNGESNTIFDPAVGEGAFFRAAKRYAAVTNKEIHLSGCELDGAVLDLALARGLEREDLANITVTDFVLHPPTDKQPAIAANPPYIRHHRLDKKTKGMIREFGYTLSGIRFDGRAGFHLYFFLRCLDLLKPRGRLAFIVSADICEGVFAESLWRWVLSKYRLDGVATFTENATPFPEVDTNPIILFMQNVPPVECFGWARVSATTAAPIMRWIQAGFPFLDNSEIVATRRHIEEGIETGFSRPARTCDKKPYILKNFAHVMRGIVTGNNDFFFLTRKRAKELRLPHEYLHPAIGRVRDVPGELVTNETMAQLDRKGRPTLLLSLNKLRSNEFPESVKAYLTFGEARGLPKKPIVRTRNPWYRMEYRKPPHFLFAYLGRRNARFILNRAKVVPLTCLHCVYARKDTPSFVGKLWRVLRHPKTLENLRWVGKTYGGGAIKVEPRALERLPLPREVVEGEGLHFETTQPCQQLPLFRNGRVDAAPGTCP